MTANKTAAADQHPDSPSRLNTLKLYYRLTKPGIIYGNLLTAIGGFLFGARGDIHVVSLVVMAAGTSLIIASACVFNNYIDRDIDAHMARTRKRALVSNKIAPRNAIIFGSLLGVAGISILNNFSNTPTLLLGIIGFVSYVGLYTFSKRKTVHSTLIGSISGSTPIAAGYTAATGHFDGAALLLFLIVTIWQMPHFYAIAMFRKDEYTKARVPILSVVHGMRAARLQTLVYMAALLPAIALLTVLGYAGYAFLTVMVGYVAYWLWGAVRKAGVLDDGIWARQMFGKSLYFLLIFSFMLSIDAWLP